MIYWSGLPDSLSLGNPLESVKYLEQVKEQGGSCPVLCLAGLLWSSSRQITWWKTQSSRTSKHRVFRKR